MHRLTLVLLGFLLAFGLGCSGSEDTDAGIQQAVERYLAQRTDLSGMRVVVEQVTFEGERATAAVTIVARNDPKARMQMMYRLRKTAEGWEVEPPQGSEAGAHGGGASAPQSGGQAPAPPPGGGGEGLPPGHPPVEGGAAPQPGELPAGHPPIGETPAETEPGSVRQ